MNTQTDRHPCTPRSEPTVAQGKKKVFLRRTKAERKERRTSTHTHTHACTDPDAFWVCDVGDLEAAQEPPHVLPADALQPARRGVAHVRQSLGSCRTRKKEGEVE